MTASNSFTASTIVVALIAVVAIVAVVWILKRLDDERAKKDALLTEVLDPCASNGARFHFLSVDEEQAKTMVGACENFAYRSSRVEGADDDGVRLGVVTSTSADGKVSYGCCDCVGHNSSGLHCEVPATDAACEVYLQAQPGRAVYHAETGQCTCAAGYCLEGCATPCYACTGNAQESCPAPDNAIFKTCAQCKCEAPAQWDGKHCVIRRRQCLRKPADGHAPEEEGHRLRHPELGVLQRIATDCDDLSAKALGEISNAETTEVVTVDGVDYLGCRNYKLQKYSEHCMQGVGWDASTGRYECLCAGCSRSSSSRSTSRSTPAVRQADGALRCCSTSPGDSCPNRTSFPQCAGGQDFDEAWARQMTAVQKASYCDSASVGGGDTKPGRKECCRAHCCFNDAVGSCIPKDIKPELCAQ